MKAISYALFGFNHHYPNSFDFNTYLRGLAINIRFNRLLFPDWEILLNTDTETFEHYGKLFMGYGLKVQVNNPAPLCKAMLWRLKPCFTNDYTHVICRDLDSPATYKEAQCVAEWIESNKIVHAITDSVSHNVPMMGGMVGFQPSYFMDNMKVRSWDELLTIATYDFNRKGTDQDLLNQVIYPVFARHGTESILQHYFLGMPNTFLSGYRNEVKDIDCGDYREANDCTGHIGAAGFYPPPTFRFLAKHKDRFTDLLEAEKAYPHIFFWVNDGTF